MPELPDEPPLREDTANKPAMPLIRVYPNSADQNEDPHVLYRKSRHNIPNGQRLLKPFSVTPRAAPPSVPMMYNIPTQIRQNMPIHQQNFAQSSDSPRDDASSLIGERQPSSGLPATYIPATLSQPSSFGCDHIDGEYLTQHFGIPTQAEIPSSSSSNQCSPT